MFHNMQAKSPTFLLLPFVVINLSRFSNCEINNCDNIDIQKLCLDQELCDTCLQAHECCNWCYDQSYTGRKCNTQKHLSACSPNQIEYNEAAAIEVPDEVNRDFTKKTKGVKIAEFIQIKPQQANIRLRKDIPVNFTFTYKSAENYPLDLYYLGDLSASMQDSLNIFKTLGSDLPVNLTQLTENYRLAYGSFMDKTGMPFYFDYVWKTFENGEPGYLFRHRLNFTRDTQLFTEKITKSKITGNLDDLDGALDAIWQILVCPQHIGWSLNSRKIILLPTDSLLHMAGDGKLVGAIKKPEQICLLNEKGLHKDPLKYDYPSVGEVDRLLKDKKVNIIFAVKSKVKEEYYKNITRALIKDSAYVGELETDSSNIIQLITKGFNNFVNQVSFSVNTSQTEHLSVKFYADCDNIGVYNETNICYGVETKPINFKVEISLNGDPPREGNNTLFIEEKNIQEKITLNISYGGTCNCKNYSGKKTNCTGNNGDFVCGNCICKDNWAGELCEIDCSSHDMNLCRMEPKPEICSGKGECFCGKCDCYFPFRGQFCEYKCPVYNDLICGGPSRGTCTKRGCVCVNKFIGDDCSCSTQTDNCIFAGIDKFCSNKGKCECNQCQCYEGYSGNYCEINRGNNTLCEIYEEYVRNSTYNETQKRFQMDKVPIQVDLRNDDITDICGDNICTTVVFESTYRCTVDFCYYDGEDGEIRLTASKVCLVKAEIKYVSLGVIVFVSTLIIGLIIIAVSKYKIHQMEKSEYKRFVEEQTLSTEMNPLYKSPFRNYENPLLSKRRT